MKATTLPDPAPKPARRHRLAARLLLRHLARIREGRLDVLLPDGNRVRFGEADSDLHAELQIKDWRFFGRALIGSDIGLGESYMDGEWKCDDIGALFSLFVRNQEHLAVGVRALRLGDWFEAWRRANTRRGSRRNIAYHYDLGNELYRLFLDPTTMTYSCGVFARDDASLDEAQVEKLDDISRRLDLEPGMQVLEIGGGWGGFAIHAARKYGSQVTSITLSQRQLELARERAHAAKVDRLVNFRLCDYRDITGAFDRIVSIEMFEAVGYEYYKSFFGACDRLLRPGGRMLLQTITVPDERFEAYRRGYDFIRKYIFPGGLLASVDAIQRSVQTHTQLHVEWMRNIGPHYAPTLRSWRDRFMRHLPEVRRLGYGDRFIRMWEFYLAACESQFAAGTIGDVQILLAKGNRE